MKPSETYLVGYTICQEVDNEGSPCEWCDTETATVEANVYLPDAEGEGAVYECCSACVLTVLVHSNAPLNQVITVEIIQPA